MNHLHFVGFVLSRDSRADKVTGEVKNYLRVLIGDKAITLKVSHDTPYYEVGTEVDVFIDIPFNFEQFPLQARAVTPTGRRSLIKQIETNKESKEAK